MTDRREPHDYGRDRYPDANAVSVRSDREAGGPGGRDARPDGHDGHDGYDEFFDFDERPPGYVRVPRRARGLRRLASPALGVVLVVVALLVSSTYWAYRQVDPAGSGGEAITVEIPVGSTTAEIAAVLGGAGIVPNGRVFEEYVRFKGAGPFAAGTYTLTEGSSVYEALAQLQAGPAPAGASVLIVPEGLRLAQIAEELRGDLPWLDGASIDAALASGGVRSAFQPAEVASLEGFLFPDTYDVAEGASAESVLGLMTGQFDAVAAQIDLEARAAALGYTPFQILTIASMIEEEARIASERPMIARVIYNRLDADMTLGIDATTLYAVGKEGNTLTNEDLDSDSPYNTRKVPGLPPGPISAPGRASLEAALAPAEGDWLYYVLSDENGAHAFTADAAEFDDLVAEAAEKGLLG